MALKLQFPIKRIQAEAQGDPPEKLISVAIHDLLWSGPEDKIMQRLGLKAYKEMSRDDEISADIDHRLTLMMPGLQIIPAGSDDKAKRLADLVEGVLDAMPGSTLSILRDQMLREALTTGFVIAEPVWDSIRIPEFGMVRGLVGLKVRPSEFFLPNGIVRDVYGNIQEFRQVAGGKGTALPSEVVYYAFKGSPNNPYGLSALHPVYDPWKYKQKISRLYITFAAINAGGLRSAEIPPEEAADLTKLAAANAAMKDLAEAGSFAHSSDWNVKIDIPPGTAGQHFRLYLEHLNRAIRMGILGDQNFNAQDTTIGTQASRTVSLTVATMRARSEGSAYTETLTEQLSLPIIRANGYMTDPAPRIIPEQRFKDDADLVKAMTAMDSARKAGTISFALEKETQKTITRKLFIDAGIDAELGAEVPTPAAAPATAVQAAAAPPGRRASDIRRQGKEYEKLFVSSVKDYQASWAELWPQVSAKLEAAIFNPKGNGWKVHNSTDIRKAVLTHVPYKSATMRKDLEVVLEDGLKVGESHAKSMIGVKGAVSTQPAQVSTNTLESSISDRSFFLIEDEYGSLESAIFLYLQNAQRGGVAPQIAQRDLRQILENQGIGAGSNATRLIDTSLTTVYNESRMNVFRGLIDPVGTTADTIPGFVYSAILDENTTDICTGYDGMAFKSDDPFMPQPPVHFNCRSVLIPVFGNEVPWTNESGGEYTDFSDSQKLAADIPPGFGGQ